MILRPLKNAGKVLDSARNKRGRDTSAWANEWGENDFMMGFALSPPPLCTQSCRGSLRNSCGLGGFLKSSLFMCYLFMWINYLKFGALYKGSSLQIMTPLHSLPMGCVCNFLEYKSCIIHVYRRATSINYVSLLGARVFTTSSFFFLWFFFLSFFRSLLCSITMAVWGGSVRGDSLAVIFPLLLGLIAQFTRVKWTVSNFQLEEDESGQRRKERKFALLLWCKCPYLVIYRSGNWAQLCGDS